MAKSTFEPPSFEKERGGARHRYEIREETLAYSAPSTASETHGISLRPSGSAGHGISPVKELEIPWRDIVRLRPGHGESLYFVRSSGQELGIWLDPKDMQVFLPLAIAAWGGQNKAAARKAALDYGTFNPARGWIWLVLSLAFPGMLALVLLTNGYHELSALNRTQRHFLVLLELSFGWIFALISVTGTGLSVTRIRRRHPYREVVRLAGEKI